MKLGKRHIKQAAGVVAGWFASFGGRKVSPSPRSFSKAQLKEMSREELEVKALNSLIALGALTSVEAQEYLFTGELPDTADITKRIIEKYGK